MVHLRSRGVFTVLKNLQTDAKNTPFWTDSRIFLRLTSAPLPRLQILFLFDSMPKNPENLLCLQWSHWSFHSCRGVSVALMTLSIHLQMNYLQSLCFLLRLDLNNSSYRCSESSFVFCGRSINHHYYTDPIFQYILATYAQMEAQHFLSSWLKPIYIYPVNVRVVVSGTSRQHGRSTRDCWESNSLMPGEAEASHPSSRLKWIQVISRCSWNDSMGFSCLQLSEPKMLSAENTASKHTLSLNCQWWQIKGNRESEEQKKQILNEKRNWGMGKNKSIIFT